MTWEINISKMQKWWWVFKRKTNFYLKVNIRSRVRRRVVTRVFSRPTRWRYTNAFIQKKNPTSVAWIAARKSSIHCIDCELTWDCTTAIRSIASNATRSLPLKVTLGNIFAFTAARNRSSKNEHFLKPNFI